MTNKPKKPKPKGAGAMGAKPVTWTEADRRLRENRTKPPKPAKPKPSKS